MLKLQVLLKETYMKRCYVWKPVNITGLGCRSCYETYSVPGCDLAFLIVCVCVHTECFRSYSSARKWHQLWEQVSVGGAVISRAAENHSFCLDTTETMALSWNSAQEINLSRYSLRMSHWSEDTVIDQHFVFSNENHQCFFLTFDVFLRIWLSVCQTLA